ncbi:MAG: sugar ABC transporter permease [Spirochaetota bacterium]|nr:MAG: sugar ABC transporter permease [Spirochaetota bacterium]
MSRMNASISITPEVQVRNRTRSWIQRNKGWLMVAPCLAIMLGIGIFPLIFSLGISFIRWEPKLPGRPFVWFANYKDILTSIEYWTAMRTTTIIVIAGVTIEFFFGLGLALLLAGDIRGKRFFMAILILPVMMVPVVVGYTWRILWHPSYGPINQILSWIVGHRVTISWLTKTKTAFLALIITEFWQWTPFMFLVLLAGLTSVNPELVEAAYIDGASKWQAFWRITLPVIRPVIMVAVLIRTLEVLKIFDIVFITTWGGPGFTTQSVAFYLYRTGTRHFRMSHTAAGSWVFLIIVAVIISFAIRQFTEKEWR